MLTQNAVHTWSVGIGYFGQILPGTKGFAIARDVHGTNVLRSGTLIEHFLHLHGHLPVEGIVLCRPVQRNFSNVSYTFKYNGHFHILTTDLR